MKIIGILLLIILIIALIIIGLAVTRGDHRDLDKQYRDEDGDHYYYDRSLIQKKKFSRRYPEDAKSLRTWRRLFSRHPEDDC